MPKPIRLLMPIVIALVLGPLIGALVVCAYATWTWAFDEAFRGPVRELFGLFVLYFTFAYLIAWPLALLAGLLMSLWMAFRPPGLVAAVAAALVAVGLLWLGDRLDLLGPADTSLMHQDLAIVVGVSVLAATVCWLLTRPFARAAAR